MTMADREKVIKGLECCTMECTYEHPFRCKGCPYSQDDAPCEALPVKRDALALLKEQDDLGAELTNAVELIHKKNERIKELLKEQEAVTPYIDIDEAKCPICKVKLTRQELLGDNVLYEDFFDYCPHCGRKVKWE